MGCLVCGRSMGVRGVELGSVEGGIAVGAMAIDISRCYYPADGSLASHETYSEFIGVIADQEGTFSNFTFLLRGPRARRPFLECVGKERRRIERTLD